MSGRLVSSGEVKGILATLIAVAAKHMGSALKPKIGAVLLAAGAGRRLGGIAKALIRIEGVSLVRRHLLALREAGVDAIVVVTGFARAAVERGSVRAGHDPGVQRRLRAGSRRLGAHRPGSVGSGL